METFNEAKLSEDATSLPGWAKVAFMTCCCERMLPNYRKFSEEASFGDIKVLRGALDAVWEWLKTSEFPVDVGALVSECERQSPDTSMFNSIYTSAALDAATATAITVEATQYPTVNRVIEVASLSRDTVDLFVQEINSLDPNDPSLERLISESYLMQKELAAQNEIMESVVQIGSLDRIEAVTRLQQHWKRKADGSGSLSDRL